MKNGCQIEYFSYLYNDSGYGSSISHTKQLVDYDEIMDLFQLDHRTKGFTKPVDIDAEHLDLEERYEDGVAD